MDGKVSGGCDCWPKSEGKEGGRVGSRAVDGPATGMSAKRARFRGPSVSALLAAWILASFWALASFCLALLFAAVVRAMTVRYR